MSESIASTAPIRPKAIETEILEKRLLEVGPGEAIAYEVLTAMIGMDVRPAKHGIGYRRLTSALRALRGQGRVFLLGGGVRRLTDAEILDLQATRTKHIHRVASRSQQEVLSVDLATLSREQRQAFDLRLSHAILLAAATTAAATKRLAAAVAATGDKLPPAKTGLALFHE